MKQKFNKIAEEVSKFIGISIDTILSKSRKDDDVLGRALIVIICYESHIPLHLVARYINRSMKQIWHIMNKNVPQVKAIPDLNCFINKMVKELLELENKKVIFV